MACTIARGRAGRGLSPPEVALHVVRLACELPDSAGRSLSQWECTELAGQLQQDGSVSTSSPQTI